MPRGKPKAEKPESRQTTALARILREQTPQAQAEVLEAKLDQVAVFQEQLENELPRTFTLLKNLRDGAIDKEEAPGAKVNLEAAKVMMEHTHRLHPDRAGQGKERVTVNVLVQMLTKPPTVERKG